MLMKIGDFNLTYKFACLELENSVFDMTARIHINVPISHFFVSLRI